MTEHEHRKPSREHKAKHETQPQASSDSLAFDGNFLPLFIQQALKPDAGLSPAAVLKLQHTYGNQFTQRLVSRKPSASQTTAEPFAFLRMAVPTLQRMGYRTARQHLNTIVWAKKPKRGYYKKATLTAANQDDTGTVQFLDGGQAAISLAEVYALNDPRMIPLTRLENALMMAKRLWRKGGAGVIASELINLTGFISGASSLTSGGTQERFYYVGIAAGIFTAAATGLSQALRSLYFAVTEKKSCTAKFMDAWSGILNACSGILGIIANSLGLGGESGASSVIGGVSMLTWMLGEGANTLQRLVGAAQDIVALWYKEKRVSLQNLTNIIHYVATSLKQTGALLLTVIGIGGFTSGLGVGLGMGIALTGSALSLLMGLIKVGSMALPKHGGEKRKVNANLGPSIDLEPPHDSGSDADDERGYGGSSESEQELPHRRTEPIIVNEEGSSEDEGKGVGLPSRTNQSSGEDVGQEEEIEKFGTALTELEMTLEPITLASQSTSEPQPTEGEGESKEKERNPLAPSLELSSLPYPGSDQEKQSADTPSDDTPKSVVIDLDALATSPEFAETAALKGEEGEAFKELVEENYEQAMEEIQSKPEPETTPEVKATETQANPQEQLVIIDVRTEGDSVIIEFGTEGGNKGTD
jgi:hypothetical protein